MPVSNHDPTIRELKAQINFYLSSITDPAKPHHRQIILRDMAGQTRRGKFYSVEALHGTKWGRANPVAQRKIASAFISACQEFFAECQQQCGGDAA